MSYADGLAAINLEKTLRVPGTEYSFERHWDLVKAETGIVITNTSSPEEQYRASQAMFKAWNVDFSWSIMHIHETDFTKRTTMGHAVFEADGSDYSNEVVCPFKTLEEVLAFDAVEDFGQKDKAEITQRFNEDYKKRCDYTPDAVNMTGLYVSLMSGLIELFGWDMLLMGMGVNPQQFGHVTNRYAEWILQYFEALAACDATVVMVHDDIVWTSGTFCHPDWYREFIFPNYKKLFRPLIDAGKKIMYTSDGTYTMFLDDVVNCGVNGLVFEPTTDMKVFAEKYGKTHVFVGNADTRILLQGSKEDIYNEVKRCMDIGKDCPGFFMAVGNHIPANTPLENALYYNECYQKLGQR